MRLVTSLFVSALAPLALLAGCGGISLIHGGTTVGANHPLEGQTASYALGSCVDEHGAPLEVSSAAAAITYHIFAGETGPTLLQRNPGEDGFLISNSWDEPDGRHYFWWGMGVGMEYIVPASGPAQRREYVHPDGRTESDGTRRPVVTGAPAATCSLVPTA